MQPVRNDPTVAVTLEGGLITRVEVHGRPYPRPYAGEGNHSTAWGVFGDIVRRTVIGVTPTVAAGRLTTLINAVHSAAERARLAGDRLAYFNGAGDRCRAAIALIPAPGQLENAIAAYLSACNYAPLASVWIDRGQATGGGEARPLSGLRATETGAVQDVADVRRWIWGLLDPRALKFIGGTGAVADAPGTATGARPDAVTRMVLRHLRMISVAYPVAYHVSGLEEPALINEHLATLNDGTDPDIAWPTNWGAAPATNGMPALAPLGWSTPLQEPLVAITMLPNTLVTGVSISGRGTTLLNEQGHHLTAHVVFESQLRRAIHDRTIRNARTFLLALTATLRTLPALPGIVDGRPALSRQDDPKEIFAIAWDRLVEAELSLQQAGTDAEVHRCVCRLAAAYLAARNALPLVAIAHGAPASPAAEGKHRKRLEDTEENTDPWSSDALLNALWGMLNLPGVAQATRPIVGVGRNPATPGSNASPRIRMAHILRTHLMSVELAWPNCVAAAEFATQSSLAVALAAGDLNPDSPELFAGLAGFVELGEPRKKLGMVGGLKLDDDDEKVKLSDRDREDIARPRTTTPRATRKKVDYQEVEVTDEPDSP
ncbi:hypothetical protein F4553_008017 [Allocatelliglobosispora scoriae]|uniref:Uncharacterized protein n=1 Tax=Allocatelliglobosispora scoriae TaxID=643052 RepID=A0A841C615_9ACTN|nr:hypothetical protein [Allocatelliglobosispora scoriae]MBB5874583.1 hypothetical protein [Allocatelliglobosispora scoriae]